MSPPVSTANRRSINCRNGSCFGEEPDDDGILLERAHDAAALDGEVDHEGEEHLACARAAVLGLGGVERRLELREVDLEHGDDDLFLGLELVVDGGLRDADGVGDHLQRGAAHTVLAEQVERGGDDAGLRGAARGTDPEPVTAAGSTELIAAEGSRSCLHFLADRLVCARQPDRRPERGGRAVSDPTTTDPQLDEFLEIRKPGAHLEEGVVADDFVLMLGVDLVNFPKFSRVDDSVTYPKAGLDIRQQLDVDSGAELPDYSGPYRADLRFTDFSREALATKFLPWSERYLQLCVDGWAAEVAKRYGAETMAEIEWAAWNDQIAPELERMKNEFLPAGTVYDDPNQQVGEEDRAGTRVVYTGLFTPGPSTVDLSKEQLVTWFLGSHEYLLQCIEAWAAQIVVRYWLDEMFDIQWTLWGDRCCRA